MFKLPFGSRPRYSIVLTSEGLWMGAPGRLTVHAPLAPTLSEGTLLEERAAVMAYEPEALKEAIRACVRQIGRSVRHAHLAVDGLLIRTMSLPIPFEPTRDELELAVRSEAERYRIFAGAEVACDFAVLDSSEEGLTVLLAAGRRTELDALVEIFEGEGVGIESIEPAPLAVFRILGMTEEPASCGVVAAFPQHLHVVLRKQGKLQSWRELDVPVETLRAGEAGVVSETRLEVQRSLHDLGEGTCFLVNVPEPLANSLAETDGVVFEAVEHAREDGGLAMQGAQGYQAEPGAFAFDLRHDRLKPPPRPVSRGVGTVLLYALLLIVALGANLVLSERVKAREAATEALQADIEAMQAEITRPDNHRESRVVLREALNRSESVASLFRRFQDQTPHDAWLSRTALTDGGQVVVEGYSLSRQAPLRLAAALGESRSLSAIEVPEVAETEWQGEQVYRFRIEAAFQPQGAFRP